MCVLDKSLRVFINKLSQAMIFVLDASNQDRLVEARTELVKLLSEKELKDASLLILANKQVIKQGPPRQVSLKSLQLQIVKIILS